MKRVTTWGALAALAVSWAGCISETTGKHGDLEFSYETDDAEIINFRKPIAVGARLDLEVKESGSGFLRGVDIIEARSSDPAVIEAAEGSEEDVVVLLARGEGSAEISVDARAGLSDEILFDAVDMLARVPERLILYHTCADTRSARDVVYPKGADFEISYEMKMNDGQSVIGYGYHPVELEPEGIVELDRASKDQKKMHLRASEQTGEVLMSSTIDDTDFTITVVDQAAIDGAQMVGDARVERFRGETKIVFPTVGGKRLCGSTADVDIVNKTPERCEIAKALDPQDPLDRKETGASAAWINIEGRSTGTCTFELQYSGAGADATVEMSVEVVDRF